MRRRFGRGRRGGGGGGAGSGERRAAPIDAARIFETLTSEGHVPVASLEPVSADDVPGHFAVVGSGETEAGERVLVGFSPRHGGDAALAVLVAAQRLVADGGFTGEAIAVAPQWSIAARRRLSLVGELPYRFRALAVPALGDDAAEVEGESGEVPLPLPAARVADGLAAPEQRQLFQRAVSAFDGLAAKHGGAVRGVDGNVELVLLARRSAVLRVRDDEVVLETLLPERSTATLQPDGLAGAMDRLEGQLRKRLNDRKARAGEEGLRADTLGALARAAGLRDSVAWPVGGADAEVIDLAGLDGEGRPVLAAIRQRLTLTDLAALLDVSLALRPALPLLFADSTAPVRPQEPRVALVAASVDEAVKRLLPALVFDHATFSVSERRGGGFEVVAGEIGTGAPARGERPAREGRGRGRGRRRGGRERGAGRRDGGEAPEAAAAESDEVRASEPSEAASMEDLSLFDLDEEERGDGDSEDTPRSRRRRRGRRRGGRRSSGAEESRGEAPEGRSRRAPSGNGEDEEEEEDTESDEELVLAPLEDVPDEAEAMPDYDEDEDEDEDDESAREEDWVAVREARRRARIAKAQPEPEPEAPAKTPRRRAAIVAHADRDSLLAAILLARDLRLVEGLWVYPQEDLMTFFRSIATDLRGETPIHVIGFTAKPARDTIQAAALYAGRISWYDHHDWPPEDVDALKAALGSENVLIEPGGGSALPAVLSSRSRRSRFSDKLVELGTGRFSQHDYERWGRLWWHRLGTLAGRHGERRADVDPLLKGRPSDLAKEAAGAATPPEPPEVAYVARRDFRVVHFGGHVLVVVPVPDELDMHLVARVARERFDAEVSLAYREGRDLVVLGSDDSKGRHTMDLGAMVNHLATKHEWIEALREEDHVARVRVRDLGTRPERLDDLVAEVAMGRSILEG